MKILIVMVLISLLVNCGHYRNTEDRHQILTICNRWERDLYFEEGDLGGNLPDYNPIKNKDRYLIKVHKCEEEYSDDFEYSISRHKDNRLTYYFFDPEILKTVPWDTIMSRKMYFDVRHYTKPELDSLDWRIEFP